MKKIALLAILVIAANVSNAQRYFSKTAHTRFFSHTSAEDIKADNYKCEIVIDKSSGAVQFSSLIKMFEFDLLYFSGNLKYFIAYSPNITHFLHNSVSVL